MGIREAVGAALLSTHLETQAHESAIDRVGALAHAGKLARLLYHWRYAGQGRYAGPVLQEMLRKARRKLRIGKFHVDHPILVRACKQAMREWYAPQCPDCQGAREIVSDSLRLICPRCAGSGLRRYSDPERLNALHLDRIGYQPWAPRMRELLLILTERDGAAGRIISHQLRDEA